MTKVKICGITNYDDAAHALILGADYIGFNFYKQGLRYIEPSKVKKILEKIQNGVKKVGIFVNEPLNKVKKITKNLNLDIIQLHGDETPEYCKKLKDATKKEIIKSFRINNNINKNDLKKYNFVDYYLFDTYKKGSFGGTGKVFDWILLKDIKKKFFLSGGLNQNNVSKAIKTVKPFAVDTASGVEKYPGLKDLTKMKKFIEAVK